VPHPVSSLEALDEVDHRHAEGRQNSVEFDEVEPTPAGLVVPTNNCARRRR